MKFKASSVQGWQSKQQLPIDGEGSWGNFLIMEVCQKYPLSRHRSCSLRIINLFESFELVDYVLCISVEGNINKLLKVFLLLLCPRIHLSCSTKVKSIYEKPTVNIILDGWKWKTFPLWPREGENAHPFRSVVYTSQQSSQGTKAAADREDRSKFADDVIVYVETPKTWCELY